MFCTRARSCARADDAKSCAVGMRNAKPGNHLKQTHCLCGCPVQKVEVAYLYTNALLRIILPVKFLEASVVVSVSYLQTPAA